MSRGLLLLGGAALALAGVAALRKGPSQAGTVGFIIRPGPAHGEWGEGESSPTDPPAQPVLTSPLGVFTDDDIEAAARMIASENPSAGSEVWVEQLWSQLRARKKGQTLHHRITGGHGWGPQNGQKGSERPVSTDKVAKAVHREVVRQVLQGQLPSQLDGARKYFHPAEQDAVFRQVQQGKADLAAGKTVSKRTQELIAVGYKLDAQGVRDKWSSEGKRLVGTLGPVEFWT